MIMFAFLRERCTDFDRILFYVLYMPEKVVGYLALTFFYEIAVGAGVRGVSAVLFGGWCGRVKGGH